MGNGLCGSYRDTASYEQEAHLRDDVADRCVGNRIAFNMGLSMLDAAVFNRSVEDVPRVGLSSA